MNTSIRQTAQTPELIIKSTSEKLPLDSELSHGTVDLPDVPLVTIQPTRAWSAIHLRDYWQYRELLYFLTWRDIKVRYKQTALGLSWVIMQPLLSTIIFAFLLGKLARVPSGGL